MGFHKKRQEESLNSRKDISSTRVQRGSNKDCKYYAYSGKCLLIKGTFRPKMSCGFIVKIGNGTEI